MRSDGTAIRGNRNGLRGEEFSKNNPFFVLSPFNIHFSSPLVYGFLNGPADFTHFFKITLEKKGEPGKIIKSEFGTICSLLTVFFSLNCFLRNEKREKIKGELYK